MKKKNMQLIHESVYSLDVNDSVIEIVRHTHFKSGVAMYSLDLNGVPLVTCDNYIFLKEVVDFCPCAILDTLINVSHIRGVTISKSEVD